MCRHQCKTCHTTDRWYEQYLLSNGIVFYCLQSKTTPTNINKDHRIITPAQITYNKVTQKKLSSSEIKFRTNLTHIKPRYIITAAECQRASILCYQTLSHKGVLKVTMYLTIAPVFHL